MRLERTPGVSWGEELISIETDAGKEYLHVTVARLRRLADHMAAGAVFEKEDPAPIEPEEDTDDG